MAMVRQSNGALNGVIRVAAGSRFTGSRRTTAVGDGSNDVKKIGQFIFIRHGEKTVDDKQTTLSTQGVNRAIHLDKVFETNLQQAPFDTVAPLAVSLGMNPVLGDRTGDHGDGVFDAQINRDDHDKLRKNIVKHADESYKGKTILICWEHKALPMIAQTLGLTDTELNWGSNPFSGADERTNYTAIWVFTPELVDDPESYFKVYKMFDMVPNLCNDEGKCPKDDNTLYGIEPAQGPYNTLAT